MKGAGIIKWVMAISLAVVILCSVSACGRRSRNETVVAAPRLNLLLDSATIRSFMRGHTPDSVVSERLLEFYRARGEQPVWFDSLSAVGMLDELRHILCLYAEQVSDSTFNPLGVVEKIALVQDSVFVATDNEALVRESELEFSRAFLQAVKNICRGNGQLDSVVTFRNGERYGINSAELLDRFVKVNGKEFESLMPIHPQFFLLVKGLNRYRKSVDENGICLPGDSLPLVKGMQSKEIPAIKRRLQAEGYYGFPDTTDLFTEPLAKAVCDAKQLLGLKADSTVDKKFGETLQEKSEWRLETAMFNIERARRLPYAPNSTCVMVNIPSFQLHVFENNIKTWSMDVIVGRISTPTVLFADSIRYIVFNPYWNVPESIVMGEILPKLKEDSTYLVKRGMNVVSRTKEGIPAIIQNPGAGNSLGKIKFMFPNKHNIYLHDTPLKKSFSLAKRTFSHGCVRLNEPKKLAILLLQNQPGWNEEAIENLLNANREKMVTLDYPVPIFLEYFTAWANDTGEIEFFDDVYNYDQAVVTRLKEELIN